jgi:hypothetical protein
MATARIDEPHATFAVSESDELLTQHLDAYGRAIRFR